MIAANVALDPVIRLIFDGVGRNFAAEKGGTGKWNFFMVKQVDLRVVAF